MRAVYLSHMIKIFAPILTVFLLSACHGESQTTSPTEPKSSSNTLLPGGAPPVDDPYFAVTTDTVAAFGPRSITRNMLQDKNGNVWFATWQGIMSYDGKQFTNHTLKYGLKKFHMFSLLEDSRGHLWFGSIRGGLYRYDPALSASGKKAFTLFTSIEGLADDMVLCMMEDQAGNVWIGTANGASVYNPTTKSFTNYTTADGLCGPEINSMVQDNSGTIWFGTRGGADSDVCYFNKQGFNTFTQKDGSRFTNVRHVLEDKKGNMWIGGQDGLFQYELASGVLIQRMPNFIGYIYEDSKSNLWLSHGEMESRSMVLTRFDTSKSKDIAFERIHSDGQVFGITEDRDGNIWFGTLDGVKRYGRTSSSSEKKVITL